MNSNQEKQAMLEDGDPIGSKTAAGPVRQSDLSVASQASPRWVRQVLRRALAAALPSRLFLTRGPGRGRSVCLTFDDGPDPILTPRLLDVLRESEIRATFFVIGEKVERYPGIVRRMSLEGHCVGSHSFTHSEPKSTSCRRFLYEVRRTAALLRGLLGLEVTLFRPPHGKLTASKLWRLLWERQTVVLWNVDPKDYTRSNSQAVAAWFAAQPLRGGDLVLLHDTVPHAIDLVPILADQARASGLTFATVADWLP